LAHGPHSGLDLEGAEQPLGERAANSSSVLLFTSLDLEGVEQPLV
jgi:hypothetical protein